MHDPDILTRFFEVTLVTGFYNETSSNETKLREFVLRCDQLEEGLYQVFTFCEKLICSDVQRQGKLT